MSCQKKFFLPQSIDFDDGNLRVLAVAWRAYTCLARTHPSTIRGFLRTAQCVAPPTCIYSSRSMAWTWMRCRTGWWPIIGAQMMTMMMMKKRESSRKGKYETISFDKSAPFASYFTLARGGGWVQNFTCKILWFWKIVYQKCSKNKKFTIVNFLWLSNSFFFFNFVLFWWPFFTLIFLYKN